MLGRVITYATANNVWYTEKFIGTDVANWTTAANWEYVPRNAEFADNLEPALAEILNQLVGRIKALEDFIKNATFKNLQVDSLDVVKNFNIYGATNMVVTGTASPAIVPDFLGQKFINSTGKISYESMGTSSSADWKQTSN